MIEIRVWSLPFYSWQLKSADIHDPPCPRRRCQSESKLVSETHEPRLFNKDCSIVTQKSTGRAEWNRYVSLALLSPKIAEISDFADWNWSHWTKEWKSSSNRQQCGHWTTDWQTERRRETQREEPIGRRKRDTSQFRLGVRSRSRESDFKTQRHGYYGLLFSSIPISSSCSTSNSLNDPGTETPLSSPFLELGEFPFLIISPLG